MPFDNFSIGKDITLDVVLPDGTPLALPVTTTGFEAKPEYAKLKSVALDSVNREVSIPQGWRGTIELDRRDDTVDSFFAAQEAGYYAGANTLTGTITETISEADGSVSTYQYIKVNLSFEEAGKKEGDKKIMQKIGFFASQRIRL